MNRVHLAAATGRPLCGQVSRDSTWDVAITVNEADVTCGRCRHLMENRTGSPPEAARLLAKAVFMVTDLDDLHRGQPRVDILTFEQVTGVLRMHALQPWTPDRKGLKIVKMAEWPA